MSGLKIVAGPLVTPISRTEARTHLNLDDDVDDSLVRSYLQAATDWAEKYTGRFFINRTCQMAIDGAREIDDILWEGMRTGYSMTRYVDHIELAATPVVSVESIKYYNDSDVQSTWETSNYYVDTFSEPARIVLRQGGTYPTDLRVSNGIEINFTVGYGNSPANVPEAIKVAIFQYITYLYEHRGDDEQSIQPPKAIRSLLDPYRVLRFNSTPYDTTYRTGII
jgi:hypothetical protein